MGLGGALLGLPRRLRHLGDRVLHPAAESATDQWQRVTLYEAVDRYLASLDLSRLAAAEISGDTYAERPWRRYESLNFPDFDICAPIEHPGAYDVVICEQVLEHVVDPFGAARNLRALCAPDGRVIVSTPFMIKVHELPLFAMGDYWRFTPRGLRTLLESGGLAVEEIGCWGNRDCIAANLDQWTSYRPWHSLRNEEDLPVQVWAFARRPS